MFSISAGNESCPVPSPRTPQDQSAVYQRSVECIDLVRRGSLVPRRKNAFHRSRTKPRVNLVKLSSPDTAAPGTILRGNSQFYRNSYAHRRMSASARVCMCARVYVCVCLCMRGLSPCAHSPSPPVSCHEN